MPLNIVMATQRPKCNIAQYREIAFGCLLMEISFCLKMVKVRKRAKIRNRYNKVPHLIPDITWESDKLSFFLYIVPDPLSSIIGRCTLYTPVCRMNAYK